MPEDLFKGLIELSRMPVKARNVLSTIEQVRREAKRLVSIAIVGSENSGKTRLRDVLTSPSSGAKEIVFSLDWDSVAESEREAVRKADAVLVVLNPIADLEQQVVLAKEVMQVNSSHLLAVNMVNEISDIEIRVRPIESFLEDLAEKAMFISSSKNLNIEDELVARVFEIMHSKGKEIALASRAPVFRNLAASKVIHRASAQNGLIGVVTILPGADMPLLTANQLKMVLKIAAIYNEELSLTRLKELITVVGTGFAFRGLARQLLDFVPGIGWVIKGAVAFTGTEALGKAAQKYFKEGYGGLKKENIKEIFS